MDKEFQTSFVPKKKIIQHEASKAHTGLGVVNLVALILFIASILGSGAAYLYRSSLQNTIDGYKTSLVRAQAAFEPTLITTLQSLDKKMTAATKILNSHVAVSPIFNLLGEITLPTVRYSDFSYEFNRDDPKLVDIKITGQAKGFNYIALQSDLFGQNKFIKNPIFSNFTLDQLGNINFNLTFSVDKNLIIYESFLEREASLGEEGFPGIDTQTSPMTPSAPTNQNSSMFPQATPSNNNTQPASIDGSSQTPTMGDQSIIIPEVTI